MDYWGRSVNFDRLDGDYLEWAKPCRNRRRTDLNWLENVNEIFYDFSDERVKNILP